jgi:hypothetical protein
MHGLHLACDTDYNQGLAENFSAVPGFLLVTVKFTDAESKVFPLVASGH